MSLPSISDKALITQERRAISNILQYIQKIVYDIHILEYVRVFEFTRPIRSMLNKFNIRSINLSELKEFRKNLENHQMNVINKCQNFGIYDY